jgi:hypothetical protein
VFQPPPVSVPGPRPAPAPLYRAVTGKITDVSPHVLTVGDPGGERRFALTADAKAWRGSTLEPAALSPGDEAIIRLVPSRSDVADRIWAGIGRVTGRIVSCDSDRIVVAEGSIKRQQTVVIPQRASGRIEVRFPNLKPGYLVDLLGIRRKGYLEGLIPAATSQPPFHIERARAPRANSGGGDVISGSAIWHDPGDEPYGVLGLSYPAIDPAAGCAEDADADDLSDMSHAYRKLPYLAIGSTLNVRNECTEMTLTLPVTGCAPMTRGFNDHCVACRLSPRGRVADLTVASFVALGGELEDGCFNATLTIGR